MDKILVLLDFTDTADISLEQAIHLGKQHNASLCLVHVSSSQRNKVQDQLMEDLRPFAQKVEQAGLEHQVIIGYGDLFTEVNQIVLKLKPDLVVVGTHGKNGLRQNLFSSNIYKLIKKIPTSTLVVNDNTKVSSAGFKKVMLPVAPHQDFIIKVEQTCELVAEGGKVVIFAIVKEGMPLDERILNNIKAAQVEMDIRGVTWEYKEVSSESYSVGYSKETLKQVASDEMDLISIMTDISSENQHFGKIDKENVLLNEQGLPVLCANY